MTLTYIQMNKEVPERKSIRVNESQQRGLSICIFIWQTLLLQTYLNNHEDNGDDETSVPYVFDMHNAICLFLILCSNILF